MDDAKGERQASKSYGIDFEEANRGFLWALRPPSFDPNKGGGVGSQSVKRNSDHRGNLHPAKRSIRIISARRARKHEERTYRRGRWGDRRKVRLIWARVDALTDGRNRSFDRQRSRLERMIWHWSEASSSSRQEKAISIRVDEDVLDYFSRKARAISAA